MPNLPTIFVTDAQADRLLAAFGSVENYKMWLKTTLIEYVIASEEYTERMSWQEQRKLKSEQLRTELQQES